MFTKPNTEYFQSTNNNLEAQYSLSSIPGVSELIIQKKYNMAIQKICTFYILNYKQDHNYNLKKECDSWLALLLAKQGKYQQSLEFYRRLTQGKDASDISYLGNKAALIKVLYQAGNSEAAIQESESVLDQESDRLDLELINLLKQYVAILDDCGQIFPLKYSFLVEKISNQLNLDLRKYNLQNPQDLAQIIKYIGRENRTQ